MLTIPVTAVDLNTIEPGFHSHPRSPYKIPNCLRDMFLSHCQRWEIPVSDLLLCIGCAERESFFRFLPRCRACAHDRTSRHLWHCRASRVPQLCVDEAVAVVDSPRDPGPASDVVSGVEETRDTGHAARLERWRDSFGDEESAWSGALRIVQGYCVVRNPGATSDVMVVLVALIVVRGKWHTAVARHGGHDDPVRKCELAIGDWERREECG